MTDDQAGGMSPAVAAERRAKFPQINRQRSASLSRGRTEFERDRFDLNHGQRNAEPLGGGRLPRPRRSRESDPAGPSA